MVELVMDRLEGALDLTKIDNPASHRIGGSFNVKLDTVAVAMKSSAFVARGDMG